jgi:hypothetical protein
MPVLPVFIKRGDSRGEVDALVRELSLTPEAAGLQKYIYASQANQTVVMVSGREVPLARSLRGRPGWLEPREGE